MGIARQTRGENLRSGGTSPSPTQIDGRSTPSARKSEGSDLDPSLHLSAIVEDCMAREASLRRRCLRSASGKASYSTAAVWWDSDRRLNTQQLPQVMARMVDVLSLVDRLEQQLDTSDADPARASAITATCRDIRGAVTRESNQLGLRWCYRPGALTRSRERTWIPAGWYAVTGSRWWQNPRHDLVPPSTLANLRHLAGP